MSGKDERRIRIPSSVLRNPRGYALQSLWAAGRAVVSVLPHLLPDVPQWGKARRRKGKPMASTLLVLSPDDWSWATQMSRHLSVPLSVFVRGIIVIGYNALYSPAPLSISPYTLSEEQTNAENPSAIRLPALSEQL